jgi:hypothetical protein
MTTRLVNHAAALRWLLVALLAALALTLTQGSSSWGDGIDGDDVKVKLQITPLKTTTSTGTATPTTTSTPGTGGLPWTGQMIGLTAGAATVIVVLGTAAVVASWRRKRIGRQVAA